MASECKKGILNTAQGEHGVGAAQAAGLSVSLTAPKI